MLVPVCPVTLEPTVSRSYVLVQTTHAKDEESVLRREIHSTAVAMHGGKVRRCGNVSM
jgi:hypothetical protein